MPNLADQFISYLLKRESKKEVKAIFSDLVFQSIIQLYTAKYPGEQSFLIVEKKLQSLLDTGASKEQLYQTLGISPYDLRKTLEANIIQYMETLSSYDGS